MVVTIPELVAVHLLRFNALLADSSTADINSVRAAGDGLKVIVFLVGVLITRLLAAALVTE